MAPSYDQSEGFKQYLESIQIIKRVTRRPPGQSARGSKFLIQSSQYQSRNAGNQIRAKQTSPTEPGKFFDGIRCPTLNSQYFHRIGSLTLNQGDNSSQAQTAKPTNPTAKQYHAFNMEINLKEFIYSKYQQIETIVQQLMEQKKMKRASKEQMKIYLQKHSSSSQIVEEDELIGYKIKGESMEKKYYIIKIQFFAKENQILYVGLQSISKQFHVNEFKQKLEKQSQLAQISLEHLKLHTGTILQITKEYACNPQANSITQISRQLKLLLNQLQLISDYKALSANAKNFTSCIIKYQFVALLQDVMAIFPQTVFAVEQDSALFHTEIENDQTRIVQVLIFLIQLQHDKYFSELQKEIYAS